MTVRAMRGATQLEMDSAEEIESKVVELVSKMLSSNGIQIPDLVSIFFTATPDLVSAFPATFARPLGLDDVPLICAQEIDVTGAMPRVVRVLLHFNSDIPLSEIEHIYLHGAKNLRRDLP